MTNKFIESRRPIRWRTSLMAIKIAQWLASKAIRPNQISLLSSVFSFFAALSLASIPYFDKGFRAVILMSTIIFIILRLLCNLFDGMLAIEGGARGKLGEFYNDLPDRPSDVVILVAMGYATTRSWGVTLGWFTAILALMTAYIRLLGVSAGAKHYFIGPMAKQHRMAVVIGACFLSFLWESYCDAGWIFVMALSFICLGSLGTIVRRLRYIIADLEKEESI